MQIDETSIAEVETKSKPSISGLPRGARIMRAMTLIIPVSILALLVISAIFAQYLAPYDPNQVNMLQKYQPPAFLNGGSTEHLLGTDRLGRDLLSRLIYGSRISLSVALIVIGITAAVGTTLGITAGYLGGRTEAFLMRFTDTALAFPQLVLAMLLSVAIGPGFWTVILALSILGWGFYARLIRGEALRLRNSDFVAQARICGSSSFRIMVHHIFPNVINPLIIVMTLAVGIMILAEAALSYLGIGVPPPDPSWGNMVAEGRAELDTAWWISTFPGIAIGLVVLSGNFLGDWLRDKLDPRLRQL